MFTGILKKIVTAVTVTAFTITFSVVAQDLTADEEAMFSSTAGTHASDDDMFSASSSSDNSLIIDVSNNLDSGLEYEGLETEAVRIGGSFELNVSDSWMWNESLGGSGWETPEIDEDWFALDLNSKVFFEARPDTDTKFYGSAQITGPLFTDEGRDFSDIVKIDELFADFNWNEDIFFRAGKQTVNSGVGYFYSPADLLSLSEIDPEDPEAVLEGPVALKTSIPLGMNSFQIYAVADETISSAAEAALVPSFEFVLGSTEIGIGAYYRSDKALRATATVTTSLIDDESIFAEALVGYGTADGLSLTAEDEFFAQLTGGLMYSNNVETEDEFNIFSYTLAGQYLFNYGDEAREALITDSGNHYLTLMGSLSNIAETDLSLRSTWQTNLSDGSGRLFGSLGWDVFDGIKLNAGASWMYGEPGSEYAMTMGNVSGIDMVTGTISASFGNGSF